jgi:hypothetical protein
VIANGVNIHAVLNIYKHLTGFAIALISSTNTQRAGLIFFVGKSRLARKNRFHLSIMIQSYTATTEVKHHRREVMLMASPISIDKGESAYIYGPRGITNIGLILG